MALSKESWNFWNALKSGAQGRPPINPRDDTRTDTRFNDCGVAEPTDFPCVYTQERHEQNIRNILRKGEALTVAEESPYLVKILQDHGEIHEG